MSFFILGSVAGLNSCTSKKNLNSNFSIKEHELLPPTYYQDWLKLEPDQLEKLLTERTAKNEQFWLQYRLFDVLKSTDSTKACKILETAKKDSDLFQLKSLVEMNFYLSCIDQNNPTQKFFNESLSELENQLYKKTIAEVNFKKSVIENNLLSKVISSLDIADEIKNRKEKQSYYLSVKKEVDSSDDPQVKKIFYDALKKEFPRWQASNENNQFEVINDLIKDRDFKLAKDNLNKIISNRSSSASSIYRGFKVLFRIEKSLQDKTAQKILIQKWSSWLNHFSKTKSFKKLNSSPTPRQIEEWTAELSNLKARWIWTAGEPETAIKILTLQLKKISFNELKEEFYYTLGRIYDEKRQTQEAHKNYLLSFNVSNKKTIIFEKNLWQLAWLEIKNRNYLQAQNHLELLTSQLKEGFDSKYIYWLAQSYLRQQKTEYYNNTIKLLREKEPLSFYTLLSYRDEKKDIPLISRSTQLQKNEFLVENLKLSYSEKEVRLISWHLSLKQNDIIKEWAKHVARQNQNLFLPSLLLYAKAEMFSQLLTSINQLSGDQKTELITKYPELLFPTPYWDLILASSIQNKIQPQFIYAIMRQESAFDPFARSSVDALGLLQLMPQLGKTLAKEENIPWKSDFDLFDEAINIKLGAKELKRLLDKNNSKYIPSIAGYNASSSAYQGWLKNRFREDPIEFIEEVPYEETRTYIKLIIRNMIFYDRLYFSKKAFPFPEGFLQIK
ncbi:MAG: lytic transglycosylase domain-containing protein [Bdellovibrionaceae bacterium]|nr:lytic transglycosylase domain-containing protein [Pseudobdellovibrionaceae bacterium]